MPQNVVDADTFTVTVQTAADGDAVNGASRLLEAQDLSDRSRWAHNRNIQSVGGDVLVPIVCHAYFTPGGAARWQWGTGAGGTESGYCNFNIGGVDEMVFVVLPGWHNCTFTQIELTVEGDKHVLGPHGWPFAGAPATLPRVTLYHMDLTTGTTTNVGNQVDTSGSAAAYDALHTITLNFGAQTLSPTDTYYVSVRGESGATAIAGALWLWGCTALLVPA
jgi:hypothetical protein